MELWLVLATWTLVGVTLWVAHEQSRSLRDDLKVRLQLQFAERFDRLIGSRSELAKRLCAGATRDTLSEDVMNYFEDLGMYLDCGYLNEKLVWRTFGFYALRWWLACKDYILQERRRHNDQTLFVDFERLAKKMRTFDTEAKLEEPTSADMEAFLLDESA